MKLKRLLIICSLLALCVTGCSSSSASSTTSQGESSSMSSSKTTTSKTTTSSTSSSTSSTSTSSENPEGGTFVWKDAPQGSICLKGGNKALVNKDSYICFYEVNNHFGVKLRMTNNDIDIAYNDEPGMIEVRGKIDLGAYETSSFSQGYNTVEEKNYGYYCVCDLVTTNGTWFRIMDSYYIKTDVGIAVRRKVSIFEVDKKGLDQGYNSTFSLINSENSVNPEDFEYFIPANLYRTTDNNAASALITYMVDKTYIKETRMGIPMVMTRNKDSGKFFSIVHSEPKVDVNGTLGGGEDGEANDDLQYGALGFNINSGVSTDFIYPCSEGPNTFDAGSGWCKRFHPVIRRHYEEFKLGLICGIQAPNAEHPEYCEPFNEALVYSFENAYDYVDYKVDKVDNEIAYYQNIDCFYNEMEIASGAIGADNAVGIPWELNLNKNKINRQYSLQYGFVGQQSSVGAHLYRYGVQNESTLGTDNIYKTYGKKILDFWATTMFPNSSKFPYVWAEATANGISMHGTAGASYSPMYLRMLCDGAEGMLDAYIYSHHSEEEKVWFTSAERIAMELVNVQNDDGSFYRAYDLDGSLGKDPSDKNLKADSKFNTPIALRFLKKMFDNTSNDYAQRKLDYKNAIYKAADYSFDHLYNSLGQYIGGTCDNANVIDKEAAVYALFGFRAAYELAHQENDLEREQKYLKVARHAACCALSWTFLYDFACPGNPEDDNVNPFLSGHCCGFSIIATGHAGADSFASYLWYDLYKLYQLNGIETYKKSAILIQNASKLYTDYYEEHGWMYPALMPEASQVSDFSYHKTTSNGSVWLPWCAIAEINPIAYLKEETGKWNLEDVFE